MSDLTRCNMSWSLAASSGVCSTSEEAAFRSSPERMILLPGMSFSMNEVSRSNTLSRSAMNSGECLNGFWAFARSLRAPLWTRLRTCSSRKAAV